MKEILITQLTKSSYDYNPYQTLGLCIYASGLILFYSFQAFKAIKCFLGKLEKCSENPELIADMGK